MQQRTTALIFVALALVSALLPFGRAEHAIASAALEVKGAVSAVTADSLSINATTGHPMTFRLTGTTVYEKYGQPAQQGDVRIGEYVKVKYHIAADGSLKAKKVKIEEHASGVTPLPTPVSARPLAHFNPFQIEGTVIGVGTDALTVRVHGVSEGGGTVHALTGRRLAVVLAADTTIVLNGRTVRPRAMRIGDTVHITGTVANGVFTARRIMDQRAVHLH